MPDSTLRYRKILLKLSGEALAGDGSGIDPRVLAQFAARSMPWPKPVYRSDW